MQLTPEQIASILEEAKPDIIKGLRDEAVRQAHWEMNPVVSKLINDEIVTFMTTEIIPEVRMALVDGKDGLLSVAIAAANQVAVDLATALTKDLQAKLEQSYKREQIFKALFTT